MGDTYSNIGNITNKGSRDILIIKYTITYPIFPDSISAQQSVFFAPDNTLKLSLNTNTVIFEDFSYTENSEKPNAVELTVSSTLPYNIKVSIISDIIGTTYGDIVDKSIMSIKASYDTSYKTFSDLNTTLDLFKNQPISNKTIHSVDMKLNADILNRVDVYKAVLKFEVEQI